jgi:hypothetical protein
VGQMTKVLHLNLLDLPDAHFLLDGIDIYNSVVEQPNGKMGSRSSSYSDSEYSPYPITPIPITISPETEEGMHRFPVLNVTQNMSGKDFVTALGEPDRKVGGDLAIWEFGQNGRWSDGRPNGRLLWRW